MSNTDSLLEHLGQVLAVRRDDALYCSPRDQVEGQLNQVEEGGTRQWLLVDEEQLLQVVLGDAPQGLLREHSDGTHR